MRKRSDSSTNGSLGRKIVSTLQRVLRRCEEVGERIGFPGEGGERRFRAWLGSELLQQVLGWPSKNIVIGERFDVLLVSDENHALATIETKTPYHKATRKERSDFEERLSGLPTLRTAYFTNGPQWDRLDIVVSASELRVLERSHLDINETSATLAEQFFDPLKYKSDALATIGPVYQVNRENPFIAGTLSRLAAHLDETVRDFATFYRQMFYGLREGRAGRKAQEIAGAVYSQWCGKSLRVTPEVAVERLKHAFEEDGTNPLVITRTLGQLGLDGPSNAQVIEGIMSLDPERRSDDELLRESIWPALAPSIDQLCAQTAHVILARALLYRVGEDEGVFERKLSGKQLEKQLQGPTATITGRKYPASELLQNIRIEMQTFLPTVYLLGEFDWWAVAPEKRVLLDPIQLAWLREFDDEMERLNKLLLRRLGQYKFESVDVDIWRNIYENYLPEDERQRLGGFYTPDELVSLVLDLDGYTPDREGLCKLDFIDPACGSGAFVTGALGRLMAHLGRDMPCHKELKKRGEPDWTVAERKLQLAGQRVHAIDLHPFASFLTTLNVLFMVLPLYAVARKQDPDFSIDLHIFSADGLEPPDLKTQEQIHLFARMNARTQLSADSYERYRLIMDKKFDRVFGNPPWGGVLKGELAPVYDNAKKKRFAELFPNSAKGKYDIYGLFVERALVLLKANGSFCLVTQGTYLDKEWAKGLRALLATQTRLDHIVDLNPFGQLFFKAMNSPCVTAAAKIGNAPDETCICVVSQTIPKVLGINRQKRQEYVTQTVREVIRQLNNTKRARVSFAAATRVKHAQLRRSASDRWDLSGRPGREEFPKGWFAAAELLEMRQGVTPGGYLEVFLMDDNKAKLLGLEDDLVHRAIKSKQLERWRLQWKNQILLYPYHVIDKKSEPAFSIQWEDISDKKLKARLVELKLEDALDFDKHIDDRELDIVRKAGINQDSAIELLKHRISLGIVKCPNAALYLVNHYEMLEGRVFEKKKFTSLGKRWYEYHRRREPRLMLGRPRLLSPTLVRRVRFVLDDVGYLSDHACLMIQPTKKTRQTWDAFAKAMNEVAGRSLEKKELLQYCLAFLNSEYAQQNLVSGHRPTPKGSYAITEAYLREIPIPAPSQKRILKQIIALVDDLERRDFALREKPEVRALEAKLEVAVQEALKSGRA